MSLATQDTPDARTLVRKHVEHHMQLCTTVTSGFGSEPPLLAEAAKEAMDGTGKSPVEHLASIMDVKNCIDRGQQGGISRSASDHASARCCKGTTVRHRFEARVLSRRVVRGPHALPLRSLLLFIPSGFRDRPQSTHVAP